MLRRFITADVFTRHRFGGNPLAVVLDASGLTTPQMQAIAGEFHYSETTFVLPPDHAEHTAKVRIFTPTAEIPFAGHPNIGTAVVLAHEFEAAGRPEAERFVFDEAAGPVDIRLLRQDGAVIGAELAAPEPLSVGAAVSVDDAAACLSLAPTDVMVAAHSPVVGSVGLPFLVVELTSLEALRRSRGDLAIHERVLPGVGTDAVFAYVRGTAVEELHARMFAPLDAITEDPATGSATAAAIALLTSVRPERDCELHWRIEQGVDMGRPSLLLGRTIKRDGAVSAVYIAGEAVRMMQGSIDL
jgi:trans-2,3-dihydro-3-hydroxyanthranilate isomerase